MPECHPCALLSRPHSGWGRGRGQKIPKTTLPKDSGEGHLVPRFVAGGAPGAPARARLAGEGISRCANIST